MNKEKQKIVPALRFPEYQNSEDWTIDKFSSFIRLYRGSSPRPISKYLTTDDNGVNWIKIGDTKNAINFKISKVSEKITKEGSKKSRNVIKGELILANSMSYGATYELDINGCIYDGWFVLREYEDTFDKHFLIQLLNSSFLQTQYKRLAAGGIVQNISSEIVYNTLLPKLSKQEQQKIANCLSSLDNLITAETDKLDHLKEHKKGLLQQLFPANGETKPQFRFSEFKNDGDWEEKCVDDYFTVGSSKRVLQKHWTNKGVPFYRTRELVSLSKNKPFGSEIFISEELFLEFSEKYGVPKNGDFLVSGVGTLGILYQVKENDKFYFKDGNVIWFKLVSGIESDYFKHCFHTKFFQKQIFGQSSASTVGTYTISNARKTKFWKPVKKEEQQKIANCLSSADDLIQAQKIKITSLKKHKKGLMQQMFPNTTNI